MTHPLSEAGTSVDWQDGEREIYARWLPKLIAVLNTKPGHEDDVLRLTQLRALIQPTPAETAGVRRVVPQHHWEERDGELEHTVSYSPASPTPPPRDGEGDLVAVIEDLRAAAMFWETGGVEKEQTLEWKAATAIEALRAERDASAVMLASRDAFIVSRGLWSEFVDSLPNQRHAVKSELVARAEQAEAQVSTLSRQLEEAREALRRGRAKAQELHEYWATERDREIDGTARRDIAQTAVVVTAAIKQSLAFPEANNPGRP